jgi:hypothetical protein
MIVPKRGITPQFESSEDAWQSVETIQSLWPDVALVLTKASRWLRVAGLIDGGDEQRLADQITRTDQIVRAIRVEVDRVWREEWP